MVQAADAELGGEDDIMLCCDSWLKHRETFRHSLFQEGFVFGVIHSHRV